MTKFFEYQIKEFANFISGYAFKSKDFKDEGIPVIKISNIRIGFVDLNSSNTQYIEDYFVKKLHKKFIVKQGDILLSLTGSHLNQPNSVVGRVAKYNLQHTSLLNQRAGKIIIKKPAICDQNYLYYLMSTDTFKGAVIALSHGAANQANVSPIELGKIKLLLPPLLTQKKIAAVLSTYDDLIENNTRRIALLERMAEELYKEWFVRMRFPGHESARFEKGIPEGWQSEALGEISTLIKRGVSPKYNDESDSLVINQKCIRNGKIDLSLARKHLTRVPNEKIVQFGDTLINSTGVGTLGRSAIAGNKEVGLTVDSHVTICRANEEKMKKLFFGFTLRFMETYFEYMSTGATGQTELSNSFVKKIKILLPNIELQSHFDKFAEDILKQQEVLTLANQNLKSTRDRLLTRLISGKLSVEELDIAFPPSMQEEPPSNAEQLRLPLESMALS